MKRTPEEKLLNPKPDSKIAAARDFGIDLALLVGTLRLTPDQRVRNLQESMESVEEFSRQAEIWREKNRDKNRIRPRRSDSK